MPLLVPRPCRVGLDRKPPATPRFNMPFELGIAVAPRPAGSRHEWFVFEERRHRLTKSLSDLNGTDPYVHNGRPHGVLTALSNALLRRRHRPTPAQLREIYDDLCQAARTIKRDLGGRQPLRGPGIQGIGGGRPIQRRESNSFAEASTTKTHVEPDEAHRVPRVSPRPCGAWSRACLLQCAAASAS